MQTILIPVDFSEVSNNAARYAAGLASSFQAKLILFHAYMLPTPVSEVPYVMVTADEQQSENERLLKQLADSILEQHDIEVSYLARIGIPSDEIRHLSEENAIDLIVMGMKGAGGLEKIIGSTTVNVIRKCKTAVLIVPGQASYQPIRKISFASDFNFENRSRTFDPLLHIAGQFNAPIDIFHVFTKSTESGTEMMAGRKLLEIVLEKHEHRYQMVEAGSIREGISNYLKHNDHDLLVMVEHKHGFFSRLFSTDHTTSMAYDTQVPLLVLEDKA